MNDRALLLTSASNSGLDQWIQLFISSNGQLQVAGGNTLHLKILWCISCQLQNLKDRQVLDVHVSQERRLSDRYTVVSVTSAVRYSRIAALYTAAVAPTLPWLVVLDFRCLWIRPTGNCSDTMSRHWWREIKWISGLTVRDGQLMSNVSLLALAQTH